MINLEETRVVRQPNYEDLKDIIRFIESFSSQENAFLYVSEVLINKLVEAYHHYQNPPKGEAPDKVNLQVAIKYLQNLRSLWKEYDNFHPDHEKKLKQKKLNLLRKFAGIQTALEN